jgi:uncharacterized protein (TIGR02118 family)
MVSSHETSNQTINGGESMATTARLLVQWEAPTDPEAFERHYREIHIPLAQALPGLRRYTLSRNAAPIRGGDPWYLVGELDWDDMASLKAAFASPAGKATSDDVAELSRYAAPRSMIYELEDHA